MALILLRLTNEKALMVRACAWVDGVNAAGVRLKNIWRQEVFQGE